jgi:hypothetical protein
MHEIADRPHERLMAIDDRLRRGAVLVESWRGHRALDVADGVLAVGDACLEVVDPGAPRLVGPRSPRYRRVFFLRASVRQGR